MALTSRPEMDCGSIGGGGVGFQEDIGRVDQFPESFLGRSAAAIVGISGASRLPKRFFADLDEAEAQFAVFTGADGFGEPERSGGEVGGIED